VARSAPSPSPVPLRPAAQSADTRSPSPSASSLIESVPVPTRHDHRGGARGVERGDERPRGLGEHAQHPQLARDPGQPDVGEHAQHPQLAGCRPSARRRPTRRTPPTRRCPRSPRPARSRRTRRTRQTPPTARHPRAPPPARDPQLMTGTASGLPGLPGDHVAAGVPGGRRARAAHRPPARGNRSRSPSRRCRPSWRTTRCTPSSTVRAMVSPSATGCGCAPPRAISSRTTCSFSSTAGRDVPDDAAHVVSMQGPSGRLLGWRHPHDPALPGLEVACDPVALEHVVPGSGPVTSIELLGYRPLRRAVVRAVRDGRTAYVKVLRPAAGRGGAPDVLHRFGGSRRGRAARAPRCSRPRATGSSSWRRSSAPRSSRAIGQDDASGLELDQLVALLDALPASVLDLPRRPAWSDRAADYADAVGRRRSPRPPCARRRSRGRGPVPDGGPRAGRRDPTVTSTRGS
jgi:hypothetical protein